MTKKKKIIVVTLSVVGSIILLLALLLIRVLFGDYITVRFKAMAKASEAKSAAIEYINEKYGNKPKRIYGTEPIIVYKGSFIGTPYFEGVTVELDGYKVRVLFDEYTEELQYDLITDNRQYDEINTAVKKYIFDDKDLGSSYDGYTRVYFSQYHEECEFTSIYFDGDAEKFIKAAKPEISADITYEGYPEKKDEYRELIDNKINEIKKYFFIDGTDIAIYIHNPELDLPEGKNKSKNYNKGGILGGIRQIGYESYLELIAYGYTGHHGENIIIKTEFYDIDKYTSISNQINPIHSERDFIFEEVSIDNIYEYQGMQSYRNKNNEQKLKVRDKGYKIVINSGEHGINPILLRFDRNYYNITEDTIPLLVVCAEENGEVKRLYSSFGYGQYDSGMRDWHYLDDNYLYLYTDAIAINSYWDNVYLTFSDL